MVGICQNDIGIYCIMLSMVFTGFPAGTTIQHPPSDFSNYAAKFSCAIYGGVCFYSTHWTTITFGYEFVQNLYNVIEWFWDNGAGAQFAYLCKYLNNADYCKSRGTFRFYCIFLIYGATVSFSTNLV